MNGTTAPPKRRLFQGAFQIVRFNWPWYVLAFSLGGAVTSYVLIAGPGRKTALTMLGAAGLSAFWLASSLLVSHLVYDRSAIATGDWLANVLPASPHSIASFHAGLDEVSPILSRRFPEAGILVFDFHDSAAMSEPSIERARQLTRAVQESTAISFAKIPLADGTLDAAFVVFAAHELRRQADRLSFFKGLNRVLRAGGDLVVVEHLRDPWNFLAFGPGALHFLPMSRWRRTFSGSGFAIQQSFRVTPFVTVLRLRGAPAARPAR